MSARTLRAEAATDSGVHVWLVLMKAHRSLARHAARSIEAFGLGLSDFAILELLLHKGRQNVNEIGRRVELTSGSISLAIDRLEGRALVVRTPHPTDRRSRIVDLTAEGKSLIEKVFALHAKAMSVAAGGMTRDERATLVGLLKKLGLTADDRLADAEQE